MLQTIIMSNSPKLKIAVLMGGPSAEHEVSLSSGQTVIKNLDKRKYEIKSVVITKKGQWLVPDGWGVFSSRTPEALNERPALKKLKKEKTDIVFIALHGEYGEDGTAQRALAKVGLTYTASGPEASILGMDKLKSLKLFRANGLEVPDFLVFYHEEWLDKTQEIIKKIKKEVQFSAVVKPVNRGSSVGVSIVKDEKNLAEAINSTLKYDQRVMVQKYIRGREVTCGILDDGKNMITPLIPTEIIPKQKDFFDYHSKYVAGATDEITPPDLPQKIITIIQKTAVLTHQIIKASGMSRTDMILGENGKLYVLEINTIPGLTPASLLPQQARAAGIDFKGMLDRIIRAALNKFSCNV